MDIIEYYLFEINNEINNKHYKENYRDQLAYEAWGLEELLDYIGKNPDKPLIDCVEEFVRKLNRYSMINTKSSYMFSCAYDICTFILDMLISMNKKED